MAISKLILCASNHHLTAGVWFGSRLHYYQAFLNNEEGYAAFDTFIKSHHQLNVYLIADAIEEEYRLETLPHTTGSARAEMLERKLNQFNRNNLFRSAHFIQQEQDKRRNDHYLFVALSNADFLQGWMAVIQVNQVPLVGLYLLPMMSQYIVQQMKLMAPNILLCERLSSGLRQTYLSNGRVRMSRLAPMVDIKPNQMAYFYLVEIEKTRLYLLSQRFIFDHTELQLVLPSIDENSTSIGKSISAEQGLECKVVDYLTYAKHINIAPDLVTKHPELLHMQLLANGNLPDNLAPDQLTKAYRINKIRSAIYVATVVIGVCGFMMVGFSLYQAKQHQAALVEAARETQVQLQRYEAVAKNFPDSPIPSADLKTATDIANTIAQYRQTPQEMMQVLSDALSQLPEIGIDRLRWVQTSSPEAADTEQMVGATTADTTNVATPTNGNQLVQVGFLNAELLNFGGDYRAALTSVNRLVNLLKNHPKVSQVVVLQAPVNVSSFASLQGTTLDTQNAQRAPAVFKLKIILKQAVPQVAP
jgi:hypothetical protein